MRKRPIRLGFHIIGDGKWTGGVNFQRTVFQLCNGPLLGIIEAVLFVAPEEEAFARKEFGSNLHDRLVIDAKASGAGSGNRALAAVVAGSDRSYEELLLENDIDVAFENARFFGLHFKLPTLSWMPDFQHRKLPHLFSKRAFIKREIGYRAQTLGRRTILLSSETARSDCENLYPKTKGRTRVARFAGSIDIESAHGSAASARARYGLPHDYFYLPNQFWTHKNHAVVLEALAIAHRNSQSRTVPPVIMSGPKEDPRDPNLFDRMMSTAESMELSDQFRHLGLIPFSDVLALNSGSLSLINPSLFEGWASSVEEAKSLGTPLILSDIPVHREQAPCASFFDPAAPQELALILSNAASSACPRRSAVQLKSEHDNRVDRFGGDFLDAVNAALFSRH